MKLMVKRRRNHTTCIAPNGRSTTNRGSSQQISSPPQMFSKATELNSHVTRLCSLIQRSIHQSLLLTRNGGGVECGAWSPPSAGELRCGICRFAGHNSKTCDYYESWFDWDNSDHCLFQRVFRQSLGLSDDP